MAAPGSTTLRSSFGGMRTATPGFPAMILIGLRNGTALGGEVEAGIGIMTGALAAVATAATTG